MSARDLALISAELRRIELAERGDVEEREEVGLLDLPDHILVDILFLLDPESRENALAASERLDYVWEENVVMETENKDENDNYLKLDFLPVDVLLCVFKYLDIRSLGRVAQVCRQFRTLAYTESLWVRGAAKALASNQLHPDSRIKSQARLTARDRVRIGLAWKKGECLENILTVHNIKYMPRYLSDYLSTYLSYYLLSI